MMTPDKNRTISMQNKVLDTMAILAGALILLSMSTDRPDLQDPWPVPEKYQSMKNPYAGARDYDDIGRTLYSQYCQTCHGDSGQGDGINAELITTPVADFSLDDFKKQPDGSLYYKIVKGRNEMPSFEYIIPVEEDRWKVVNYVKAF